MEQSSTNNFTKLSNQLLKSNKFTGDEKILLSWVIGWQEAGKDCIASNNYIANELGMKLRGLQYIITKLNKYSFFTSNKQTKINQYNSYVNSKIMYVNVEELNDYISNEKKKCNPAPIEEPNPPIALTPLPTIDVVEEELICEVITDGIEDFIPKVVECITPTDTKELNPLKITIEDIHNYLLDNAKEINDNDFERFYNLLEPKINEYMKNLKDWNFITNFIDNKIALFNKK